MIYRGDSIEEDAEGLFAVCIQHEMDHLEGILFIDHLSRLKKEKALAKLKKARKAAEADHPASDKEHRL
jgi:peptide deformylase